MLIKCFTTNILNSTDTNIVKLENAIQPSISTSGKE